MKTTLTGLLVVASCSLAHAAPPLLEHATIDQTPGGAARSGALLDQRQGALACGATQCLAVWQDGIQSFSMAIKVARLNLDGTPIDDPALVLVGPSATALYQDPAVSFDGTSYLVSWWDQLAGRLEGRTVNPAGALGATAFQITTSDPRAVHASSGGVTLLVSRSTATTLVGRLISGGVVGAPFNIATAPNAANAPAITAGPDGFVIAYESTNAANIDVAAVHVTTAGVVTALGQLNSTQSTPQTRPSITFGGGQYLAVWGDSRANPRRIWGAVIASPPVAIATGATEFEVEGGDAAAPSQRPQVAFFDGHFVVAWEKANTSDGNGLGAAVRITPPSTIDGAVTEVLGSTPRYGNLFPDTTRAAALGTNGTTGLLLWARSEPSGLGATYADLYATPIGQGVLVDTTPAVPGASERHAEREVEVGSNGQGFVSVWTDNRDVQNELGTELFFQRFDAHGAALGAATKLLSAVGDQRFPAIAGLPGGDYLVAWMDKRSDLDPTFPNPSNYNNSLTAPDAEALTRLHIARLAPDGTLRDAGGIPVMTPARSERDRFPRIAVDPVNLRWLVTWDNGDEANSANPRVYAMVVDADGTQHAPVLLDDSASTTTIEPVCAAQAAWSGNGYLVVAERGCSTNTTGGMVISGPQRFLADTNVVGYRLDATGALVGGQLTIANDTVRSELAPTVVGAGPDPAHPESMLVAWQDHGRLVATTNDESCVLRGAKIAPGATTVTPLAQPLLSAASSGAVLRMPRLAHAGSNLVLSFLDRSGGAGVVRALRLGHDGVAIAADVPADTPLGAILSAAPVARTLPYGPAPVAAQTQPDPFAAPIAVNTHGQVLLAYTADDPAPIGRAHVRGFGGRVPGAACDRDFGAGGCGDGFCERDPGATTGLCCPTSCSNPCQRCTATGCDATPASDTACGTVTCAALSTECRVYRDAPARCLAFGQCSSSNDLSSCTPELSDAVNEGGACTARGCSSAGACNAGECVCPDQALSRAERTLKDGCSAAPGQAGGGGGGAFVVGIALCALLLRRRARGLLALVLVSGALSACADDGVLGIDLELDDETGRQASTIRFVIEHRDATIGFAPAAASGGRSDLVVRNVDIDGDGVVEIVADLQPAFPVLRNTTYLAIRPSGPATDVVVHAIAINRHGNPIARVDGNARLPGDTLSLELSCTTAGCGAIVDENLITPAQDVDADQDHPVSAIAGTTANGVNAVAVGVATHDVVAAGAPPVLGAGEVVFYVPTQDGSGLAELARVTGGAPGDFFGASVAIGSVTSAGSVDVVVGAPGANLGAGRVYVLTQLFTSPTSGPITASGFTTTIYEGAPGDRLGVAVGLVDTDGDGLSEVIAGAPGDNVGDGRGRVYLLRDGLGIDQSPVIGGPKLGAHLGVSVATRGSLVAAGAPGVNSAFVFDAKSEMTTANAPARVFTGTGGGVGIGVVLADLDADGTIELVTSAPTGTGALYAAVVPDTPRELADADLRHVIRGQDALGQLGALVATVRSPAGDALVLVGAPPTDGLAYLVRGSAIEIAGPSLPLGPTSEARAARIVRPGAMITAAAAADLLSAAGPEVFLGDSLGGLHSITGRLSP